MSPQSAWLFDVDVFAYENLRRRLGVLICLVPLIGLLGVRETSGQLIVVVNQGNEIESVTLQSLRDIYAGNKVSWSNNRKIFPVSMKSNREITKSFFQTALGKSAWEMKRVWIRLTLSGSGAAPKVVGTETEALDYIAKNDGAIGFVGLQELNERVKIVAVEGKLPSEEGYPLRSDLKP